MDILSFIGQIIRDLLIFAGACFALLVILLIVVSRLSPQNPLRQLLNEVCRHVAVTLVAGLVAIPIEPIPGVDVAYDTLVPLALLIYWIRFIWRVVGMLGQRALPPPPTRELPPP
jgi:hypothetical protein